LSFIWAETEHAFFEMVLDLKGFQHVPRGRYHFLQMLIKIPLCLFAHLVAEEYLVPPQDFHLQFFELGVALIDIITFQTIKIPLEHIKFDFLEPFVFNILFPQRCLLCPQPINLPRI